MPGVPAADDSGAVEFRLVSRYCWNWLQNSSFCSLLLVVERRESVNVVRQYLKRLRLLKRRQSEYETVTLYSHSIISMRKLYVVSA